MTPDERNLLQRFLQDLVQTRGPAKDPQANGMIAQTLCASPDAAYLLVQHAIMSDQALHAARDQIAALQSQVRPAAPAPQSAGFLPGGASPWAQAQHPQAPQPQAPGGFIGSGPFSGGGGLSSFIRGAAPMAAGVVGGEMLFHGLEGIFGRGRGGGGGFGGGGMTENVTNNYYSDDSGNSDDQGGDYDDGGGSDDSN